MQDEIRKQEEAQAVPTGAHFAENGAAESAAEFVLNRPEESMPRNPFADEMPVFEFLTMPEEGLAALCEEFLPAMRLADLRFCREQYRREGRVATYGELRMLEALIAERRRSADRYVMSRIRIGDGTVAATYEDMMAKCRALYPNRQTPFTVAETAQVSGAYMNMIGRGSDRFVKAEPASPTLLPGTAFLLLVPGSAEEEGAYEGNLAELLTNPEIAPLYTGRYRVSRYGILGTLASLGKGIFADFSLLPRAEGEPLRLRDLVVAHGGRLMLSATRENAAWLCRYAERYALKAIYFAKVTETGRWRTSREISPATDLSIPFLLALLNGMDMSEVSLPEENFRAVCPHTCLTGDGASAKTGHAVTLLASPEENCFSAAVNLGLEAVIRLVCRGVDRRAIGFTMSYAFPRYGVSELEMGKNLSTILGAYRVMMELAAPECDSSVDYIGGSRRLACTAYTPHGGSAIPERAVETGTKIGYLSFCRNENGVPDFESFRQMCDHFHAWCAEGKIRSARGVSGDLLSAMADMASERVSITVSADAEAYRGCYCQGILFEFDGIDGISELGYGSAVAPAEQSEATEGL